MNTVIEENEVGTSAQGGVKVFDHQDKVTSLNPDVTAVNEPQQTSNEPTVMSDLVNNPNQGNNVPEDQVNYLSVNQANKVPEGEQVIEPKEREFFADPPVALKYDKEKLDELSELVFNDPKKASEFIKSNLSDMGALAEYYGFGRDNVPAFTSVIRSLAERDERFKEALSIDTSTIGGKMAYSTKQFLDTVMELGVSYEMVTGIGALFTAGSLMSKLRFLDPKILAVGLVGYGLSWLLSYGLKKYYGQEGVEDLLPERDFGEEADNTAMLTGAGVTAMGVLSLLNSKDSKNEPRRKYGVSEDTFFENFNRSRPYTGTYSYPTYETRKMNLKETALRNVDDALNHVTETGKSVKKENRQVDTEVWHDLGIIKDVIKHHPLNAGALESLINQSQELVKYHNSLLTNNTTDTNNKPELKGDAVTPLLLEHPRGSQHVSNFLSNVRVSPQYISKNKKSVSSVSLDIANAEPYETLVDLSEDNKLPYSNGGEIENSLQPVGYGGHVYDDFSSGLGKRGSAIYPLYREFKGRIEPLTDILRIIDKNVNKSKDVSFSNLPIQHLSELRASGKFVIPHPYFNEIPLNHAVTNVLAEVTQSTPMIGALNILDENQDQAVILSNQRDEYGSVGSVLSNYITTQLVNENIEPHNLPNGVVRLNDLNVEQLFNLKQQSPNGIVVYIDPYNNNDKFIHNGVKEGTYYLATDKDLSNNFVSPFSLLHNESGIDSVHYFYQSDMFKNIRKSYEGSLFEKDFKSAIISLLNVNNKSWATTKDDLGSTEVNYNLYKKYRALLEYKIEERLSPVSSNNNLAFDMNNKLRNTLIPKDINVIENPLLLDAVMLYQLRKVPIASKEGELTESSFTKDEWDNMFSSFLGYMIIENSSVSPTYYGDSRASEDYGIDKERSYRPTSSFLFSGKVIGIKQNRPLATGLTDLQTVLNVAHQYTVVNDILNKCNGSFKFNRGREVLNDKS